jgi:uncharacterized protein
MRLVIWRGIEEWLAEAVSVELGGDGLSATGTQLGADPVPYRLDYRLDASDGFVTRQLELTASVEDGRRTLTLHHDGSGGWSAEAEGDIELPDLSQARDIDIGFSPLTNSMPILRHGLHRQGEHDFVMAWVEVPSLNVIAAKQRYEHLDGGEHGATVRFLDGESDFTADLELDREGLLVFYPELARRVAAGERVDEQG